MRWGLTLLVAAGLTGCVGQFQYSYQPPSLAMIKADFDRQAAEAEAEAAAGKSPDGFNLMKIREMLPALALCTKNGRALEMWSAETRADQFCGKIRLLSGDVEQVCLGVDELTSIGVPHVARVFGYYPGTSEPVKCS